MCIYTPNHQQQHHPTNLRLPQNPQLPITNITRHIQPPPLIKRQPRRPKTPRTRTRPIPRTLRHIRIRKDILRRAITRERLHRDHRPIRILLEIHHDKLKPCCRASIPAAVERDKHLGVVGVELAVYGRGVREEG